jgi:hypothetical protein
LVKPFKKRPGLKSCEGLLGLLAKPSDCFFSGVLFNIERYPLGLALIVNPSPAFIGGEESADRRWPAISAQVNLLEVAANICLICQNKNPAN